MQLIACIWPEHAPVALGVLQADSWSQSTSLHSSMNQAAFQPLRTSASVVSASLDLLKITVWAASDDIALSSSLDYLLDALGTCDTCAARRGGG